MIRDWKNIGANFYNITVSNAVPFSFKIIFKVYKLQETLDLDGYRVRGTV